MATPSPSVSDDGACSRVRRGRRKRFSGLSSAVVKKFDSDVGDENLRVGKPEVSAGGVGAARTSLRQIRAETGLLRGARALLKVNQAEGFDCPGCAWPEPDDRSHLEICENGAKAVAEEATRFRIDAAFFAANPISALRERSEHWLGKQGRLTAPVYKAAGDDHYRPIAWDDAFRITAAELARA